LLIVVVLRQPCLRRRDNPRSDDRYATTSKRRRTVDVQIELDAIHAGIWRCPDNHILPDCLRALKPIVLREHIDNGRLLKFAPNWLSQRSNSRSGRPNNQRRACVTERKLGRTFVPYRYTTEKATLVGIHRDEASFDLKVDARSIDAVLNELEEGEDT